MKKMVLGCIAATALLCGAAPAQNIPKLSEFLLSCARDSGPCRLKIKDYVTAASTQKSICLPKGVSITEGASEVLRWLKSEETHPAALRDVPFDDALFEATTKLYPCAVAAPPAEPVTPPPAEPAAAAPAAPPPQ